MRSLTVSSMRTPSLGRAMFLSGDAAPESSVGAIEGCFGKDAAGVAAVGATVEVIVGRENGGHFALYMSWARSSRCLK